MELTLALLQEAGSGGLPGLLGIDVYEVGEGVARARLELEERHLAPNGYLHAGNGRHARRLRVRVRLHPQPARGRDRLHDDRAEDELPSQRPHRHDRLRSALAHGGRTTQIWDATVFDPDGRSMALFRCTQLLLRAR